MADGLRRFSDTVGGYWSADNARFAATNPSFGRRMMRAVNPMTGLGSTLGSVYDAANAGDLPGLALESLAAIPMFGEAKFGKVWLKGQKPVISQGLRGWRQNAGEQLAADSYEQMHGR